MKCVNPNLCVEKSGDQNQSLENSNRIHKHVDSLCV